MAYICVRNIHSYIIEAMSISDRLLDLKNIYLTNKAGFEFYLNSYLGGSHNKQARVEVMKHLTGKELPPSQCKVGHVRESLAASFDQFSLF